MLAGPVSGRDQRRALQPLYLILGPDAHCHGRLVTRLAEQAHEHHLFLQRFEDLMQSPGEVFLGEICRTADDHALLMPVHQSLHDDGEHRSGIGPLHRAYPVRQLSHDDTFVGWLHRTGQISEREARHHPRRTALQKALPDFKAQKGESALLVTNGGLGYFDANVDKMAVEWNAMGLAVANAAKHKLVGLLSHKLAGDGVYVGEVVVLGMVKGSAFDNGHGTILPTAVAGKFWDLYRARTTVSVDAG